MTFLKIVIPIVIASAIFLAGAALGAEPDADADNPTRMSRREVSEYVHPNLPDLTPVVAYVEAVEAENLRVWLAELERQAQVVAAVGRARALPGTGSPSAAAPSGDCYENSPVPAYITSRESGGDAYVTNGGGHAASPYEAGGRAFGCHQIMPYVWDANCSDITDYSPAGQHQCASRLPASAWASTR